LSAFGPLGTLAGAALDGGMMSAAINAGVQLATTGQVNWTSVGNSFTSGALSAGLSFGVGEMMGHATTGLGKTLAHGLSGGVSSMASGGSFGSGFVSGAVGNMASEASMGAGMLEQAGIAGLAGGITSMASGGDFAGGFQNGAYNVLYNHFAGSHNDVLKDVYAGFSDHFSGVLGLAGQDLGGMASVLGGVAVGTPDSVYDGASITLGVAEVVAYATGVGALTLGAANLVLSSGALYKTYKSEGLSSGFYVQAGLAAAGPFASGYSKFAGVAVGSVSNRLSLIYGHVSD